MASQADPSAGPAATHACPRCSKTFSRLCDLNKHSKSHSRPYKCNDPTCKYSTLGWPTAKELERHHNDKHSATPRTFPCLFQPCPYWSKRESNCKQHMETAHDWKYIRSKSKGKGLADQHKVDDAGFSPKDCVMGIEADQNNSVASSSPQPMTVLTPATDFILFDEHTDAMGDDDDHLFPGFGDSQNSESYLPWTSPVTRLRNNELFIEKFSQRYDGIHGKLRSVPDSGGFALEPALSPFGLYGLQHQEGEDQGLSVDGVFIKPEPTDMVANTVFPRKRNYEPVEAPSSAPAQTTPSTSGVAPQRSRKAGTGQAASTPSGPSGVSKAGGSSSSEDGRRPKKKPKHNPAEDFTDTSMPDIFRHAHPHIYDRNRTDKYSACHTVHRDISTLVRHLSRPSHRLEVTERTISSFDIEDPGFRHQRAGVCRSCWQTFGDRAAFDDHKSRTCAKVSKGKREKWRILYESFTPLSDSADAAMSDIDPSRHTEEQWERLSSHLDESIGFHNDGNANEAGTPPTSVPSPAIPQPADFAPFNQRVGRFVAADEHVRLQREHQALRERHQQLERMAQVLLVQQLIQENMKDATAPGDDTKPPTLGTAQNNRAASSPGTSDRDSLVQHMDSQSTDVDVHGFMDEMEDTHQTISRMNSGLSTASRSTIHRVPPSPPSRPAELPGSRNSGPPNQQDKHSLAHRPPPPSIPDSGYGTELRRGSLGDIPKTTAVEPVGFGPTPPSTAEAAGQQDISSQKMGEGIPWAESPSQRIPRATISSPQHSQQPGFLIGHEMSEFEDAYRLVYRDDSDLQSHASPPGFTFESHSSQIE